MSRIVTYACRRKSPPRKLKIQPAAITVPSIVTAPPRGPAGCQPKLTPQQQKEATAAGAGRNAQGTCQELQRRTGDDFEAESIGETNRLHDGCGGSSSATVAARAKVAGAQPAHRHPSSGSGGRAVRGVASRPPLH
jgi:hypothetical protein